MIGVVGYGKKKLWFEDDTTSKCIVDEAINCH